MTYGQTSAGKTFTLFGDVNSPEEGIVPRFSRKLFEKLSEIESGGSDQTKLTVSLFEIYKEKVFDLFGEESQAPLHLREDPIKGVYLDNLSHKKFNDANGFLDELYAAFVKRRISETYMNERSSRSHLVVTFDIEVSAHLQCQEVPGAEDRSFEITKRSRVIFIDLAGSERQSTNTAEVLAEGCHINRSLSILQHVISAIAKKNNADFVHFRDSKLTHFLKEIFKGNSHFAILGNVLGNAEYYKDTQNTLNFVAIAKKIVTNPQINFETKEADRILGNKIIELFSKNLKTNFAENSLNIQVDRKLSELQTQNEKLLLAFEKIQEVCSESLRCEKYDEFKLIMDKLEFDGLAELQTIYCDLNSFLVSHESNTQINLGKLNHMLQELQTQIDVHFGNKKSKLQSKLELLLDKIQSKFDLFDPDLIRNDDSMYNSAHKRMSKKANRSFDLSHKKEAVFFPQNLMKTLKNHSRILKQNEQEANNSEIKLPEMQGSSIFKSSQVFNKTGASFLGSFLPPFGGSASKILSPDFEKDIAQSIQTYFQRERSILESEKQQLQKEKQFFEETKDVAFQKNDFKKQTTPQKITVSPVQEGLDNDNSGSTLKVQTYQSLMRLKSIQIKDLPLKANLAIIENKEENKPGIGDTNSQNEIQIEISKKKIDVFNKRISNLERQLRNRNKDYLFALKELEKLKFVNTRRENSVDANKSLFPVKV